jgi:glutamate synthase (NADPH/NADH) small chain
LLALGFTGHEPDLIDKLNLETNENQQIKTKNYQTSIPNIFSAGDMRRGQSLIVWAISEGREAAYQVDKFLMGSSKLETKEKGDLPLVR